MHAGARRIAWRSAEEYNRRMFPRILSPRTHHASTRLPGIARALACGILLACVAAGSRAEDLVWATGKVLSADGKRPIEGAVVAVFDQKNRVIDFAKTGPHGEYAIAVPRSALNLSGHGGGFLRQVTSGVGMIAGLAVGPIRDTIRSAAGTPGDPMLRAGVGAASGVAGALVGLMAPPGKRPADARKEPGAIVMKVSAPGRNDALSVARVYWMQEEIYRVGGAERRTFAAWIDPVEMRSEKDQKRSTIESDYLKFTDARLDPSIAERGDTVTISVKLPMPKEPVTPVIVIARNSRTGAVVQLEPVGGDRYEGRFVVDKKMPRDDQTISILAYAEAADKPGRNRAAEAAILRAGMFDPRRPFVYNPLLVASRNRADVILTVVEKPKR